MKVSVRMQERFKCRVEVGICLLNVSRGEYCTFMGRMGCNLLALSIVGVKVGTAEFWELQAG